MLSDKIRSVHAGLGALAGAVSESAWETLQAARVELADAAEVAMILETAVLSSARHRAEQSGQEEVTA